MSGITETTSLTREEKEILKVFENVIPSLNQIEKARILGFGEGLAVKTQEQQPRKTG